MLKLFRNQGKTLRWIMGTLLFLIAASMIITLIPNVFGPASPASGDVLAEIDGLAVTTRDVDVELRQQRANGVPDEAIPMVASGIIENLIAERVLLSEADDLGLVPTDKDVAEWLREYLPDVLFPDGEFIGARAYEGFIRQQFRRTVAEFEREVLYNLAIDLRLRRMVTDSVSVSEEEVKQRFHRDRDTTSFEWVAVDSASLRGSVSPTADQLREYFESNGLRYRRPERRALKLITVGPEAGAEEHQVTEAEVELYYSQNEYRFEQPERIRVRHILFMTMDKTDEESEEARSRAEDVLRQLEEGGDFEQLAKLHSEDPGNADNGGDLGWVSRGMMDPAFEDAAFALPTGETSAAPVKSDFGYHLIRLDERETGSVKPLSEVREVILGDIKAERSQAVRYSLMERAMDAAQRSAPAIETAATELGLPYQEFPAFGRSDLPDELPKAAALVQAVFEELAGEVFTLAQEETLYIGFVNEVVPARDAEYEEVEDTVRQDYVDTESANLARQRAEELAQLVREESTGLAVAARDKGLAARTSELVERTGEIEDLGSVSSLGEDAFDANGGELQGPVPIGDRWIVFRTVERREADESALTTEGDTIRQTLLVEKQSKIFDYFRDHKVREYMDNGLLIRYGDRIQSYLRSMQGVT